MKRTRRTMQVGEVIRDELSRIFRRELDAPELELTSITGVDVSADLKLARVHVSVIGGKDAQTAAMRTLERTRRRIRHLLASRVSLRHTPELEFRLDETAEHAMRIEELLHEVLPPEPEPDDES